MTFDGCQAPIQATFRRPYEKRIESTIHLRIENGSRTYLVGLSRKLLRSPSIGESENRQEEKRRGKGKDDEPVSYSLESVTGGDTDDVDVLVLLEDGVYIDGLLKVRFRKLDFVGDGSSVDLDLHEVRLLLLESSLADLGVGEDTNDGTVLANSFQFSGDGRLGSRLGVLLGVLGEGLFLGSVPGLVESSLDFVGKVLGPNGGERSQSSRSLDVTDDTDDDHGRGLDDGDGLDDFSLVHLYENAELSIISLARRISLQRTGSRSLEVSDDMGHTGLVSEEGGEVDGLLGVILNEK